MEFDDTPFRAGTDETWALYDIEGTPENFYVRLDHRKGYNQFSVQMSSPILVTAPASKIIDQGWIQNRGEDMSLRAYFNGTVIIISGVGPFAVSAPGEGSGAWMSMSLGWLGTRSLRRICMPGTHNSGVTKSSVKVSSIIVPPTAVICQSGSIWEQLRWGARYFDIRPAYSNKLGFHTGQLVPPESFIPPFGVSESHRSPQVAFCCFLLPLQAPETPSKFYHKWTLLTPVVL